MKLPLIYASPPRNCVGRRAGHAATIPATVGEHPPRSRRAPSAADAPATPAPPRTASPRSRSRGPAGRGDARDLWSEARRSPHGATITRPAGPRPAEQCHSRTIRATSSPKRNAWPPADFSRSASRCRERVDVHRTLERRDEIEAQQRPAPQRLQLPARNSLTPASRRSRGRRRPARPAEASATSPGRPSGAYPQSRRASEIAEHDLQLDAEATRATCVEMRHVTELAASTLGLVIERDAAAHVQSSDSR